MEKYPILNERLFLRSPSINVCFRAVIEGVFDRSIIEEAFKKVSIKHPLLHCFVEKDNNYAWLVQNNSFISIEYYKSNELDWQTWYKKTDNIPFGISQGPLVKFCVITDINTEIIVLGHHIIGDGIGYLNLVKDILLALDNRIELTPQLPPYKLTDRKFKKTVLLTSSVQFYANYLNKKWKKSCVQFSENDYLAFFESYRNKYKPNLVIVSIEGESLTNLLKKSKSNGLTINEIIASAFSLAVMEVFKCKEIGLGVAVNIRNELISEPNDCMGNFVSGILVKVHYKPSNDFISNAKIIAAILKNQLENKKNRHFVVHFLNMFDSDLIESIMFAAYGGFNHPVSKKIAKLIGEQKRKKVLGISNLGRYEFYCYDNFKVMDIQFIEPAFPANAITVGIITVNSKMNLCIRYNEGEIKTEVIRNIYEKGIELLKI